MLVEQVDAVGAQPAQRCIDDVSDVLRLAVETVTLASDGVDVEGELDDLVADRGQGFADELLIDERPVGLGGVEEGHTAFNRIADQRDHLRPVWRLSVVRAHSHAPQSECGNLQRADLACGKAHVETPPRRRWAGCSESWVQPLSATLIVVPGATIRSILSSTSPVSSISAAVSWDPR